MVAVKELTVSPGAIASLEEQLEAAASARIVKSPRGYEIFHYEDSLQVLRSPDIRRAKLFLYRADNIGLTEGYARDFMERMLNTQEGEQRKHLRTPMARLLSPRKTKTLTEAVRDIVNTLLDEVQNPDDVDFLKEVSWRLPPEVYCHMVSIPRELAPTIGRLSDSLLGPLLTVDSSRKQELIDAHYEVFALVEEHIETRRKNLNDDFTSALIEEEMAGNLSTQELYDTGVGLLEASVDNTVHQSAIMMGMLLEDQGRWQQLLAEPGLMPNAVEETLRVYPRFRTHMRYVPETMDVLGTTVPKDDLIFIHVEAAQNDPTVFDNPSEFDMTRPMVPGPLLFGQGQYSCIGQNLARLEMHTLLTAVMERFPNARLIEPWQQHEGPFVREVTSLRISLTGK
ncbi:cytochrome P450 [Arthrobacter sp. MA-N2]|uniref:cytochrome P450 n=1 Tax=Arthrobacter sp. MA-N2 TaxID=1101188 RepID=UPI000484C9F0|nr:cytochrome P450 [Arthrobacter sp. MA-N2]